MQASSTEWYGDMILYDKITSTGRRQTSAKAADPTKFLQLPGHRSGKIPLKFPISRQISTKTEWFVASHVTHPQKISQEFVDNFLSSS